MRGSRITRRARFTAYITRSSFSAKPVRSVCNARYTARPLGLANRRPHLQKAVSSTVWAATLSRTRTLTVTMWSSKADVYGENLHLAHRIADALPGARVLPGRFNVVQMAIGVRKRAGAALPTVDEFVNRIRSDGTMQKAITEAGLR